MPQPLEGLHQRRLAAAGWAPKDRWTVLVQRGEDVRVRVAAGGRLDVGVTLFRPTPARDGGRVKVVGNEELPREAPDLRLNRRVRVKNPRPDPADHPLLEPPAQVVVQALMNGVVPIKLQTPRVTRQSKQKAARVQGKPLGALVLAPDEPDVGLPVPREGRRGLPNEPRGPVPRLCQFCVQQPLPASVASGFAGHAKVQLMPRAVPPRDGLHRGVQLGQQDQGRSHAKQVEGVRVRVAGGRQMLRDSR